MITDTRTTEETIALLELPVTTISASSAGGYLITCTNKSGPFETVIFHTEGKLWLPALREILTVRITFTREVPDEGGHHAERS